MKSDVSGCSTCPNGQENYETFMGCFGRTIGKTFYQYDYRHTDGELFSCVAPTLEKCRERRDKWLEKKGA